MRTARPLLAAAVGTALVACEPIADPIPNELQPNFMMGAPVVESVSGSGHFTWMHPDGREGWRTFSFTARKNAEGLVDGRFVQRNRGAPQWSRGVVTCFSTNAEQAWLEIVVEDASDPQQSLGERAFWVEDMGEGRGADPDRISLIRRRTTFYPDYENPGDLCNAQPWIDPSYVREIEAGNIQVNN